MASNTGENDHALHRILDMTRLISLALLGLHFYYYCYTAFAGWDLVSPFTDRIIENIAKTGLFSSFVKTKLFALGLLAISLLGAKGRKEEKLSTGVLLLYIAAGVCIYFLSQSILAVDAGARSVSCIYFFVCTAGYLLILSAGTMLSRVIRLKLTGQDIFNRYNESFPQSEKLIENQYSINLPARYYLKGRLRRSWINFINPFRGILVLGSPGSGKTYFVIRHIIAQHIQKGFSMFVYDFKFDDLTKITYNTWLQNKHVYKVMPRFYVINFDDLSRSHRCNPIEPSGLLDITDAAESARTILMGLNKEWIKRQGDFFVESPINFLTAIIWFLRKYHNGAFCTLPHVIELMQVQQDKLFTILRTEPEIQTLISPFVSAFINDATQQLEGQIATAQISMARLSSASLYYVLSGNDFSLDINDPKEPKIVCMGNNPEKILTYGAVLSLYVTRLIKLVNKKGKLKSSLIFDEFPTIYLNHVDSLMATARSNRVSTTLGLQDLSQLRKEYGREQADVIMNITGNIISGQVSGDTAKQLSERVGRIMQDRTSFSINRTDTSVSRSKQLDTAIPPSRINALSSGEFVGLMSDNPDQKIELKAFQCEIINDHQQIRKQQTAYRDVPLIRNLVDGIVQRNFDQIRQDIADLIDSEIARMLNDPELQYLVLVK
ncbi:conjugal transfer protein MobC [Dyadobacter sp. CY312]|uniref:conjugal transfer protein MobC n=1 Tax=Dyadobacter sp. CY312 TaxID=2907303 RepID=UPI001F24F0B6|nr:conjugal transfer protein MobC [Dyadobacter sp. CY312]MCE7044398.1 YWFCY domain-containing protein [Dyadobacter sp. CY312]